MTDDEAVKALDAIASGMSGDPEVAHSKADDVLLAIAEPEVAAAYQRVVDACKWWATA